MLAYPGPTLCPPTPSWSTCPTTWLVAYPHQAKLSDHMSFPQPLQHPQRHQRHHPHLAPPTFTMRQSTAPHQNPPGTHSLMPSFPRPPHHPPHLPQHLHRPRIRAQIRSFPRSSSPSPRRKPPSPHLHPLRILHHQLPRRLGHLGDHW